MINAHDVIAKEEERRRIQERVAEWQRNGGKVTVLPVNERAEDSKSLSDGRRREGFDG